MKRSAYVFVFLLGVLAGALGNRWAMFRRRPHPPDPDRVVARLARQLSLTPDQQGKVRAVLVDEQAKMKALHEKLRADFEANRADLAKRLSAVLTDEQKPKFEALEKRWEERHKKIWGAPPPPPGPGPQGGKP